MKLIIKTYLPHCYAISGLVGRFTDIVTEVVDAVLRAKVGNALKVGAIARTFMIDDAGNSEFRGRSGDGHSGDKARRGESRAED